MPTPNNLIKKYLYWLYYEKLFPDQNPAKRYYVGRSLEHKSYWLLANHLFKLEFSYFVPNDDNRAADGISYRQDFSIQFFKEYDIWWDEPCTVLEMLVALSSRMEDILENPMKPSYIGDWFVLLISNLGMKNFTDVNWSSDVEKTVTYKINNLTSRKYDRDGNGGLFPLDPGSREDQRTVEIWYQMMAYINQMY